MMGLFAAHRPDVVIHLAAQAGVRDSIENPRSYLDSKIIGTFEILEAAPAFPPAHMLLASISSASGANSDMSYAEVAKADHQMSFYAATKKATEAILEGRPLDVYNHGDMKRDFTAVSDLVTAILLLIQAEPVRPAGGPVSAGDRLSPVAPWPVANIGHSEPVQLTDFSAAMAQRVRTERRPVFGRSVRARFDVVI